jgi:hypothetical protein
VTILQTCTLAGTSIKTFCKEIVIKKKILFPNNATITCVKQAVDSVVTPTNNQAVVIAYNDSIGTYTVFSGKIVKVTTSGKYYKIDCISSLTKAFDFLTTKNWTAATNHDTIMDDILNDGTIGVDSGITVTNTVGYHTSLTNYNVTKQPAIDQLRKLCWYSRNTAGDPLTIFYQDSTATNTIVLADYGDTTPASAITISHANGSLLSPVSYDDTSKEVINQVTVKYRGGQHTSADGDTGGYSTSTSRGNFGTRNYPIYRPEIDNATDCIATEATYLRTYSCNTLATDTLKRFSVDVKHQSLHGNSTHYPVLNTKYTVIDAVAMGTLTDQVCIEHTLRWPSFKDTLTFGYPSPYDGDQMITDMTKRIDALERDNSGLNIAFKAYRNSDQTGITYPDGAVIQFDDETFDIGSNYNNTSGGTDPWSFVAPIAGIYFFQVKARVGSIDNGCIVFLSLEVEGADREVEEYNNTTGFTREGIYLQVAGCVQMAAGDSACGFIIPDASSAASIFLDSTGPSTEITFQGFLVAPI